MRRYKANAKITDHQTISPAVTNVILFMYKIVTHWKKIYNCTEFI